MAEGIDFGQPLIDNIDIRPRNFAEICKSATFPYAKIRVLCYNGPFIEAKWLMFITRPKINIFVSFLGLNHLISGGNHKDDFYDRRIFECWQQNVEIDGRKNT